MTDKFIIRNNEDKSSFITKFSKLAFFHPLEITITDKLKNRTNDANSLYWVWMTDIATKMSDKHITYTKRNIDLYCRKRFLGETAGLLIGSMLIDPQVKEHKNLKVHDFCVYMNDIEDWAAQRLGFLLPTPANNEYEHWLRSQAA